MRSAHTARLTRLGLRGVCLRLTGALECLFNPFHRAYLSSTAAARLDETQALHHLKRRDIQRPHEQVHDDDTANQ